MSNIIVRVPQPGDKPRPTFIHFCILLWSAFWRMAPKQRANVGVAALVICLPMGIVFFAAIDKVVASVQTDIEKPMPRMTMRTPAALTLSVEDGGEPAIWKVPEVSRGPVAKKKRDTAPREASDLAPVSSKQLFKHQTIAYINKYKAVAIRHMGKHGIPASISLAQGLIESRAGTSSLAVANNNHFGMKCFARSCKKGHCSNFTDDTSKDFFKKYKTPYDSWEAHALLISSGRYLKLKKHGRDYRKWAYGLKAVGYATDRKYAEKLIGIIERYNLNKYD